VSYLDIAFGATLGGDVQGPYGANTVYKLLGVPLPPLTVNGYLQFIPGTGLVLTTPGGGGLSGGTQYNIPVWGAGGTSLGNVPPGTSGIALVSAGAASNPVFGAINLGAAGAVTGTLPVASGGFPQTGSQYSVPVWSGTNTLQNEAPGTSGWVLTSNGPSAYPTFQAPSGGLSGGSQYAIADWTSSSGLGTISPSATVGMPLVSAGASAYPSFAALPLATSGVVSGVLPVANGGHPQTGVQYDVMTWAGAQAINNVAPSATVGLALVSAGSSAYPAFGAVALGATGAVSGQLPAANGGTGATSLTAHAVVVAEGSSAMVGIGPSANTGAPLLSGGASADPAFGPLNLAGGSTIVTGTLPSTNLPSLAGDVTGAIGSTSVQGMSAGTATLTWSETNGSPQLTQTTRTSDLSTHIMYVQAQSAYAGAATNTSGASLFLRAGNSQSGNQGGRITLSGGYNTASSAVCDINADIVYLYDSGNNQRAGFEVGATFIFYPETTNTGTIGAPTNVWSNVYSTNCVLTGPAAHSVLIGEGTSNIVGIPPSSNPGWVLTNNVGADPSWQAPSGGGLSGLTQYGTVVAASSTTVGTVGPGTAGQLFLGQSSSSNPAWESMSQDASITAAGVLSVLKATAATGMWMWSPSSTLAVIAITQQTSDTATQPLQIIGQDAYASASGNTAGGIVQIGGGNSQIGRGGAHIYFAGGNNTANSTVSSAYFDTLNLLNTSGATEAVLNTSGAPLFYPNATNTGTLGQSANVWSNVYSVNHVLTGPAAHSVLIGEGTGNINGVGPSATTGALLLSAGSSADPAFSTKATFTDSTALFTLSTGTDSKPGTAGQATIVSNSGHLETYAAGGALTQLSGNGSGTIHSAAGQISREMAWLETSAATAVTFYTLAMPSSGNHVIFGRVRAVGKATSTLAAVSSQYLFTAHSNGTTATSDACTIVGTAFNASTITAPAASNTITLQIAPYSSNTIDWQFDIEWQIN